MLDSWGHQKQSDIDSSKCDCNVMWDTWKDFFSSSYFYMCSIIICAFPHVRPHYKIKQLLKECVCEIVHAIKNMTKL